jgi:ABC-2 type transport system ATP-binding protein
VEPEILLIDEILSVGDQAFQRKSSEKIEQFRREGRTIVVVSHSLPAVQQLCKEVIWLEKGRLKQRGPAADVIAAYTGGSYTEHAVKDANLRERWGTGDAHFTLIELRNDSGQSVDRIDTNGSVVVHGDLTPQSRLTAPILKATISKLDGEVVWSSTSQRLANPLRAVHEPLSVSIHIPVLPLLEGTYFLSMAVTDSTGTTEYDHCQNWVRFDVHQIDLFEEGVVTIPATWQVQR